MSTINLIDLLRADGFVPFQKTEKEWASACAFCPDHGRDRLIIFPAEGICGRYWCRCCRRAGTAYTYLIEYRGLAHEEVCEVLDISEQAMCARVREYRHMKAAEGLPGSGTEKPPCGWQIKAAQAVAACERTLWSGSPKAVRTLKWLRNERGLSDEVIKTFHLGLIERTVFRDRGSWELGEPKEADK